MKKPLAVLGVAALFFSVMLPPALAADTLIGKCVSISVSLSFGARGDAVTKLQQFLSQDKEIYPDGIVSGYFGALTQGAVQRYQARYGIVTSGSAATTGYGSVGPKTRAKLLGTCSASSGTTTTVNNGTTVTVNASTTGGKSWIDLIHGVTSSETVTFSSTSSPANSSGTTCALSLSFSQIGNSQPVLNLSWNAQNATGGNITGIGTVAATGSIAVAPATTTTYVGTFTGSGGSASCSTTVNVSH